MTPDTQPLFSAITLLVNYRAGKEAEKHLTDANRSICRAINLINKRRKK